MVTPVPWPEGVLQSGAVCLRLVWQLWELGQPGVPLSAHPLPQALSLGLLGALAWLLPCPALVRTAISLAICCLNSVAPSPESVATTALALTLSQISSFLLFTFLGNALRWLTGTATTKDVNNIKECVNQLIEAQSTQQEILVHIVSILNVT